MFGFLGMLYSFLGIVGHYWNYDTDQHECVGIDLFQLPHRHFSYNIASDLKQSLCKETDIYNILSVFRFVTDGAGNMKAAFR